MEQDVRFYGTADDYGDFSNFAAFPIRLDGEIWPTSEHYFQAQKFERFGVGEGRDHAQGNDAYWGDGADLDGGAGVDPG